MDADQPLVAAAVVKPFVVLVDAVLITFHAAPLSPVMITLEWDKGSLYDATALTGGLNWRRLANYRPRRQ